MSTDIKLMTFLAYHSWSTHDELKLKNLNLQLCDEPTSRDESNTTLITISLIQKPHPEIYHDKQIIIN